MRRGCLLAILWAYVMAGAVTFLLAAMTPGGKAILDRASPDEELLAFLFFVAFWPAIWLVAIVRVVLGC